MIISQTVVHMRRYGHGVDYLRGLRTVRQVETPSGSRTITRYQFIYDGKPVGQEFPPEEIHDAGELPGGIL